MKPQGQKGQTKESKNKKGRNTARIEEIQKNEQMNLRKKKRK